MIKLAKPSADVPYSVHVMVTSRCNLSCQGCYYRDEGEWTRAQGIALVWDAARMGVEWIAIGGGEPTLWPGLEAVLRLAKNLGVYTALTTNGTVLHNGTVPDRVHVSHDHIHNTTRKQVEDALDYYRGRGARVGINTIAKDEEFVEGLPVVDDLVLLLEKPDGVAPEWVLNHDALLGACLGREFGHQCYQGRLSMSVSSSRMAGPCSNLPRTVPYTSLRDAWEQVRLREICMPCEEG